MHRVLRSLLPMMVLLVLALPAWAHDGPHGNAATVSEDGTYGAPITEKKAVNLSKLAKSPGKYKGKTVRLEGVVKDVCQGQGCWIEIESKGTTFLVKSLDESVLVPKDSKGQSVVVQGVVTQMPAKAHEHKEGEEGHSCPQPTWLVSMLGVELKK